jgi:cyclopropane fatty-acyl-phospholipid synthase-like methyltransferase
MELNDQFWENRYQENNTGWDIGYASTPIVEYLNSLKNKELKILIPGCGNGHEAEWAQKNGFSNVHILDFAASAIENFKKRYPEFNTEHLHQEDFFEHQDKYDLIIEQTFFCAIDPALRARYAQKMHQLLNDNGLLVGLLFDASFPAGPPFGGNKEEYDTYFSPLFEYLRFEKCNNSIPPRSGKELFVELKKIN